MACMCPTSGHQPGCEFYYGPPMQDITFPSAPTYWPTDHSVILDRIATALEQIAGDLKKIRKQRKY